MFLFPLALIGLIALVLPIAIHILAKRRAERVPFPTLRFIRPGRLAAAVFALAGPLVVTRARQSAWDAQLGASVVDGGDLGSGIRRAASELLTAPPGRLEIVVRSTFPLGSIRAADVRDVPPMIGIRFERTSALPATRTVDLPAVLTPSGTRGRTMTVDRGTAVREVAAGNGGLPIAISTSAADRAAIDAALAAVVSERTLAPRDGRRVRMLFSGAPDFTSTIEAATPVRDAWMADALAAIAGDDEVRALAARATAALTDTRVSTSPWIVVARAANGRPLAAGAATAGVLTIVTTAPPASLVAPILMRSALNAIGDRHVPIEAETMAISDAQLRAWTRPPPPAVPDRPFAFDRDDRRWLWIAALLLLGLEWRMRSRPVTESVASGDPSDQGDARVA